MSKHYERHITTVTLAEPSHSKLRRWKSMLIHQGWFTALNTQHLLDSQSLEFLICILLPANMPLIRCTNVFYKGDYPVTLLPPSPRRLAPSLGLGTTWVRQLRSGSCHHPTAATKCNVSRTKPQQTPSVEKHAHPPRVVYCAKYPTLTRFTKSRVSNLHITTR